MITASNQTHTHAEEVQIEYIDNADPPDCTPHTVIRIHVWSSWNRDLADHTFFIFAPLGTRL